MLNLFARMLNLRSSERSKVGLLMVMFFVFILGITWAETIIESSFYFFAGVNHLSQVFTLHAVLSIAATIIYTIFVDQVSNQKLLVIICGVASLLILLVLLVLASYPAAGFTLLYVLVRAIRTMFVMHWWNYASDFYDVRAAKRIVPVINSASRVAIVVAGLSIPLLNRILPAAMIIAVWVVMMGLICVFSGYANRSFQNHGISQNVGETQFDPNLQKKNYSVSNLIEGFHYVFSSSYLRWLALSTFLMVLIFAILNYQSGSILTASFHSRADLANFIGMLNGLTSLLMLPVQMFFFSRFVSKIGVGNANLIFPVGTFLISAGVIIAPASLVSAALAHFDRNTFRYSTHETSTNFLYQTVPDRVKGRARSFVDGMVLPIALLASGILLEAGRYLPKAWFLPVLLGIPALGFVTVHFVIRQRYSHAVLELLSQTDLSIPFRQGGVQLVVDPSTRKILVEKLEENVDPSIVLLICRIILETEVVDLIPALEKKALSSEPSLRAGIIDLIAEFNDSNPDLAQLFVTFLRDPDDSVRLSANRAFLHHEEAKGGLRKVSALQALKDKDFRIRLAGAIHLIKNYPEDEQVAALAELNTLSDSPDDNVRAFVINEIAQNGLDGFQEFILRSLQDPSAQVRVSALNCLEKMRDQAPLSGLLRSAENLVNDPDWHVRYAVLQIAERIPAIESISWFETALFDSQSVVRQKAQTYLTAMGEKAVPTLLKLLESTSSQPLLRSTVAMILCRANVRKFGYLVDELIKDSLERIFERFSFRAKLVDLPELQSKLVLDSLLQERVFEEVESLFQLLGARYGDQKLKTIRQSLSEPDIRSRANASEALEALVGSTHARLILPLVSSNPGNQIVSIWETELGGKSGTVKDTLLEIARECDDRLLQAVVLFVLGEMASLGSVKPLEDEQQIDRKTRAKRGNLLDLLGEITSIEKNTPEPDKGAMTFSPGEVTDLLTKSATSPWEDVRDSASAALLLISRIGSTTRDNSMADTLSMVERIIFLKQVAFFQNMTIDQLKSLAEICEEESVREGTRIFEEGDAGGVVYMVISGRVAIERHGDKEDSVIRLSTLEAKSSFGEMSLFDDRPRSASALCLEDTLLLKLRFEPLLALIQQHPDLSIDLIKILSERLREANEQIAHLSRSMPRKLRQVYDQLEDLG